MDEKKKLPAFSVKVLTFNIASGHTLDGRLDLELTASAIEKTGAEIAGLQEVDRHFGERSRFMDQVKWLANRLGMFVAFGPAISEEQPEEDRPDRQFGNAVLSRFPIIGARNYPLTLIAMEGRNNEPRVLLETVIEKDGRRFAFYNTHLSLKNRELEVNTEEVLNIIDAMELPVILAGDFNSDPRSPQIEKLRSRFTDVFGGPAKHPDTFKKTGMHGEKIDYIFFDRNWRACEKEVVETAASDHYPVVAELQLFTKP